MKVQNKLQFEVTSPQIIVFDSTAFYSRISLSHRQENYPS